MLFERAVVMGGSMAGLLVARVLADFAGEVVIVDRDQFPEQPEFRAGVPQARHAHALLLRGHKIIEALLPGIEREMLADGARLYDVANDFAFFSWAGNAVRFESGVPWLAVSRPFLEHHVRRRVLALPNVRVRMGVRVAGLEGTAERITGVRVQGDESITADLVVDASGRESKATEWLASLGVTPPVTTAVKPYIGYSSRTYEPPARSPWDHAALIAMARPPVYTRGVSIVPIENGRFTVTLIGMNRDYPPTSEDGFLEFARSLELPGLPEWLAGARPVTDIHGFRFEENRRRLFERCALPAGYLAVGDAVTSFNPIYGQGMTTAAIGVETLASVLARTPDPSKLPRIFHRQLAKVLDVPWNNTTTEDLRYPGTEGERKLSHRLAYAYMDRLFVRSSREPAVRLALIHVFGMTKPPTHLLRLPLALRALTTSMPRTIVRPQHALRDKA